MPAYANEPAWFIGRIDGDLYPQPAGAATLTEHAEIQKAALLHSLSQGDNITGHAFELTIEGGDAVNTLDAGVTEAHTGALSLGQRLENEHVDEFTAKVQAGDGEHLEPLSVMGFDIFTGDEESVVAQLDEWSGFNHSELNLIPAPPGNDPSPTPRGPDQPLPDITGTAGPSVIRNLSEKGQGVVPDIVRLPGAVFREINGQDDIPILPL